MNANRSHSVLLGGVGGDCHSVGLTILRHSLTANGYRVHYLGTQNRLQDFLELCSLFNVVMISSMDGHGRYYLAEFPALVANVGPDRPLWYVGGNLCIGSETATTRQFLEMQFDRVFVKFTDVETVLQILEADLASAIPKPGPEALVGGCGVPTPPFRGDLLETRLEVEELRTSRKEVLRQWKTGRAAARMDENAVFLTRQPSFPKLQHAANRRLVPLLVHPRCGVALAEEQIRIFAALKQAGASVLSFQVDSLTRLNEYAKADEAIRDSQTSGQSALNGFPVVSHGVPCLRRISACTGIPLQTRHSTRDPRLLAEISYAGGLTAFEGGAISYNIPYYKDYPLADSIPRWQYVDRLTGLYHERFGVVLDREFFGTLTGTLVPPCLAIAVNVLEAILAVRQGVKCVSLGYAEQGHRIQDIAAIRALRRIAEHSLRALGHHDVQISTVFHQYMAAFPSSRSLAETLIYQSAITAALSGATRVMVKTPAEAIAIPTVDENVLAIHIVAAGIAAADTERPDERLIEEEADIIRRETEAILDSVILSGAGGVAQGVVAGFQKGYIDIPFSPSLHNKGAVVTARDVDGAVRLLSIGELQFGAELRDFHRFKMDERRRSEGILSSKQSYQLVEKDVMRIARGEYPGWPLSAPHGAARSFLGA